MLLLCALPAIATDHPKHESATSRTTLAGPTDAEITKLVRYRIVRQRRAHGAVLAILRPEGPSIVAFHDPSTFGEPPPDANSIFEIASLSKIFTALLLADATVRGEVRLNDPLSAYVPAGVRVPQFDESPITLVDLATHGSGLPLRPNNLAAKAPDAPNKYAGYTLEQLYSGLADYQLTRAPGTAFEYSNLGFALLGQGLALALHEPYADLLRERITRPLGMTDTHLGENLETAGRHAQGHGFDLRPIGPTDDGALNPAGGLRSTADDLSKFLALFVDGAGPGELPSAALLMLTVDRPGDDAMTRMTLGWRRTTAHDETYYWSNGSGDGSRTFMGFNPARRVAVVALADAASTDGFDDIARRVLDPKQVVDLKVLPWREAITLPESAVNHVIGNYQYAPDDRFEVSRGSTGLIVTAGKAQFLIQPLSRSRYFAPGIDLLIDFKDAASGPASALVLHQSGKSYIYKRVP
jgi:CubicO group peptidase (beta-lactamase class C family)